MPTVEVEVKGITFRPSMAYIVGPAWFSRVTVLLTEEKPHRDCSKAEAAATRTPSLHLRVLYGGPGGGLDVTKLFAGNDYMKSGGIEFHDREAAQWLGQVRMKSRANLRAQVPAEDLAGYAFAVRAPGAASASIQGTVRALVCVTQQEWER